MLVECNLHLARSCTDWNIHHPDAQIAVVCVPAVLPGAMDLVPIGVRSAAWRRGLSIKSQPETKCKEMEGLIEERDETAGEYDVDDRKDAVLIAAAERVEHYKIAAHGVEDGREIWRYLSSHAAKSDPAGGQGCRRRAHRFGRLWYVRTVAKTWPVAIVCQRIKSGRLVRAPATEPETRLRCQPPESGGMRPVGGKNPPCSLSPRCNSSGGSL